MPVGCSEHCTASRSIHLLDMFLDLAKTSAMSLSISTRRSCFYAMSWLRASIMALTQSANGLPTTVLKTLITHYRGSLCQSYSSGRNCSTGGNSWVFARMCLSARPSYSGAKRYATFEHLMSAGGAG